MRKQTTAMPSAIRHWPMMATPLRAHARTHAHKRTQSVQGSRARCGVGGAQWAACGGLDNPIPLHTSKLHAGGYCIWGGGGGGVELAHMCGTHAHAHAHATTCQMPQPCSIA